MISALKSERLKILVISFRTWGVVWIWKHFLEDCLLCVVFTYLITLHTSSLCEFCVKCKILFTFQCTQLHSQFGDTKQDMFPRKQMYQVLVRKTRVFSQRVNLTKRCILGECSPNTSWLFSRHDPPSNHPHTPTHGAPVD